MNYQTWWKHYRLTAGRTKPHIKEKDQKLVYFHLNLGSKNIVLLNKSVAMVDIAGGIESRWAEVLLHFLFCIVWRTDLQRDFLRCKYASKYLKHEIIHSDMKIHASCPAFLSIHQPGRKETRRNRHSRKSPAANSDSWNAQQRMFKIRKRGLPTECPVPTDKTRPKFRAGERKKSKVNDASFGATWL